MFIRVKVFPGSKKEEIVEKSEHSFEIKIKEKPKRGEANKRLVLALALYFKIAQSKIKLVKGFRQRNKIFEINK